MHEKTGRTMNLLALKEDGPARAVVSPYLEMGAYESLWLEAGASVKTIAEKFGQNSDLLPSDLVPTADAERCAYEVLKKFKEAGVHRFGIRVHHAGDYPEKMRDARYPVDLLYYQGIWEISYFPSVAVVGSRKPSEEGIARTRRLVKNLVDRGYVVASGLATGIDTAAHTAAIEAGGLTMAVIGTPLGDIYPKENAELQKHLAEKHLLVSQVPVLKYHKQHWKVNRSFFPERNATMSALTDATIIVEASDTSGTLIQARAALYQKRKLFILNSCFERDDITWPARFAKLGAIRVRDLDDIWEHLA